jgi:hypothetical protein
MDIFNGDVFNGYNYDHHNEQSVVVNQYGYDSTATHHAPWMCTSHTWGDDRDLHRWNTYVWGSEELAGAEKMVSAGEFIHYEQHLTVSERFPLTPLRNCLFTPELQWQSRGK